MIITVKVAIPARVSFDTIRSLKSSVAGRSNPLGLKSILKVITLIARSHPLVTKGQGAVFGRGNYDACEDMGQVSSPQGFIEAARQLGIARQLPAQITSDKVRRKARPRPLCRLRYGIDLAQKDR